MPAPTQHFVTNVASELAGGTDVRQKVKVNPFQAATNGQAAPPPAPLRPSGKQWPR